MLPTFSVSLGGVLARPVRESGAGGSGAAKDSIVVKPSFVGVATVTFIGSKAFE